MNFLLSSCANIAIPTGGPKDEKAPELLKRSLNDSSVLFKGGKIHFDFNEFVQLKEVQKQMIVSPLLTSQPKVTATKKRVTIHIPDSILQKNTTYQISMGNAIQDIRESNPYQNLSITFTTGAWFDSLMLQGNIIDAQSGMPDTSSLILLYPLSTQDSMLLRTQPMYVTRTQSGFFTFKSLPDKPFKLVALTDKNNNLLFDAEGERIAFYDVPVYPSDTSFFAQLFSFAEQNKIDTGTKKFGKMSLNKQPVKTPLTLTVSVDTTQPDKRTGDISKPIVIESNHPIDTLLKSKLRLYQKDILETDLDISLDSTRKIISLRFDWIQEAKYKLQLLQGFVKDTMQQENTDISYTFTSKKQSDYATLQLQCEPNPTQVILLYKQSELVASIAAKDSLITIPLLTPDTYTLRLLKDTNGNQRWDTGNLKNRIQPEIVEAIGSPITLKANWENKIDIRKKKKE